MKHYKTGFVIGRFQPFHKGHAYLLKKAASICDELIIGIGSVNKSDTQNPWDEQKRIQMLKAFIKEEGIEDKVKKIIAIPDTTDEAWTKNVVAQVGSSAVVIGNNDWVNHLLQEAGFEVVTLPYFRRHFYEGQKIRNRMSEKKPWEKRVPSYLLPIIK